MSIESVRVIVSSPARNFVTLKVVTTDGIVGWGDATVNGRELSVASYLEDHIGPPLIGRDENNIEDTWQYLYRGAYWRRGPITMAAIAAVDMALWDIKAKKARVPLYQLLGGASRSSIRAYGHAAGADYAELKDSVQAHVDQGFTAVRIQTAIPGLGRAYGVQSTRGGNGGKREPMSAPPEDLWDTRDYLAHMPDVFARVREDFGPRLRLLHDGHHRMSPVEAARFAKNLEPYDLMWLEDCTPAEDPAALRLVREHSTTPLAVGEVFNAVFDYQTLITERLIDYVRSAVTHTGGISAVKKIVDFAGIYGIKSAFHGPTDISPIGMAAALHLDLAVHNFGIQEYMPHDPRTLEVFQSSFTFDRGFLHPGEAHGLGVEVDESAAAGHEYIRSYLPVNRLKDGTLHDW